MSGRVKKLLHLRISTIILLFWGGLSPQERKFFLGSLTLAITIPPLASMSRRPWPVYTPAVAGTHSAYPGGMARLLSLMVTGTPSGDGCLHFTRDVCETQTVNLSVIQILFPSIVEAAIILKYLVELLLIVAFCFL